MKASFVPEKLRNLDRSLMSDVAVALAVAFVFALFAVTVMRIDANAGSPTIFFPGRTVYM